MNNKTFGILIVRDTRGDYESENENCAKIERAITDFDGQVCCMAIVHRDENVIMKNLIYWSEKCKLDVIIISEEIDLSDDENVTLGAMEKVNKASEIFSVTGYSRAEGTPKSYLFKIHYVMNGRTCIIYPCLNNAPANVPLNIKSLLLLVKAIFSLIFYNKMILLKEHSQGEKKLKNLTIKQEDIEKILTGMQEKGWDYEEPTSSVAEAVQIITDRIALNRAEIEEISLEKSFGRILATTIQSDCDVPSFRISMTDGYAVENTEKGSRLTILDNVESEQEMSQIRLEPTECIRVSPGGLVPEGAQDVIDFVSFQRDGTDCIMLNDTFHAVKRYFPDSTNIKEIGGDFKKGSILVKEKTCIGAEEFEILTKCGVNKIPVFKRPIIGILSIGNNLQERGEEPKPNHIYDSSRITLMEMLKQRDYNTNYLGTIKNDFVDIVNHINDALNLVDVLIMTESASIITNMMLRPILKTVYGADIHIRGVKDIGQGRRIAFATYQYNESKKYFLCLPGSPASVVKPVKLLVIPLLDGLHGLHQTIAQ